MPYNKIKNFTLYEIKIYVIKIYCIECMLSFRISRLVMKHKFSKINQKISPCTKKLIESSQTTICNVFLIYGYCVITKTGAAKQRTNVKLFSEM